MLERSSPEFRQMLSDADRLIQFMFASTEKLRKRDPELKPYIQELLAQFGGTVRGLEEWIKENKVNLSKPSDLGLDLTWLEK